MIRFPLGPPKSSRMLVNLLVKTVEQYLHGEEDVPLIFASDMLAAVGSDGRFRTAASVRTRSKLRLFALAGGNEIYGPRLEASKGKFRA